ncbi:MAG: YraN family protein [Actinomycetaceae bacterium]|nr:YraN family protein [Actinomycetaceae bacterium]
MDTKTSTAKTSRQLLGRVGEELAAQYLREHGWQILSRNYRARGFELDLIARRGTLTAIVEVRTRKNQNSCDIAETVTAEKLRSLRRGAAHWRDHANYHGAIRFDVITVNVSAGCAHLRHYPHFI